MFPPTLAQKNQPSIPLILLGKKRVNRVRRHSAFLDDKNDRIQMKLDHNLDQIFKQIRSKRMHRNTQKTNFTKDQLVTRLDQKIVRQYISFVYKQYNLPDPLSNIQVNIPLNYKQTTQKKKNFKLINQSSTNRKAVHLKQSFLIQMFSPTKDVSFKENFSSIKQARSTQLSSPPKVNKFQGSRQVKESYRYCFVCQQPILQVNIQVHEQQKCPQFSNLYKMSVSQLKQILIRKIQNIKKRISKKLISSNSTLSKSSQKSLQMLQRQAKGYVQTVQSCLRQKNQLKFSNSENKAMAYRNNTKQKFNCVMKTFETEYFYLYSQLQKLQWFMNMFFNFQSKFQFQLNQTVKRDNFVRQPFRRMSLAP